jgi:hypothetical protein
MKRILGTAFAIFCAVMIALPTTVNSASLASETAATNGVSQISLPVGPAMAAYAANRCQVILTKAMETLQSTCKKVGRNKACYGNNLVQAESASSANLVFNKVGDIANISQIRSISTAPLDEEKGIWGLSLLKLQANLPDSLPGQNVTFLVFGNTHVDNTSGDMRSFYFTSGLGVPSCKEAPKDSIVVKSPDHMQVTFNANGTKITIASTIVLRAEKGNKMTVALVEGRANVTTPQGSQDLKPGQQVTVQLGGDTGLAPVAPPSAPTEFTDQNDAVTNEMIVAAQEMGMSSTDDEGDPTIDEQDGNKEKNGDKKAPKDPKEKDDKKDKPKPPDPKDKPKPPKAPPEPKDGPKPPAPKDAPKPPDSPPPPPKPPKGK